MSDLSIRSRFLVGSIGRALLGGGATLELLSAYRSFSIRLLRFINMAVYITDIPRLYGRVLGIFCL